MKNFQSERMLLSPSLKEQIMLPWKIRLQINKNLNAERNSAKNPKIKEPFFPSLWDYLVRLTIYFKIFMQNSVWLHFQSISTFLINGFKRKKNQIF